MKLNKLFFYIMLLFVIISCMDHVKKDFADENCEIYVAAKKGFWIEVILQNNTEEMLLLMVDNKKVHAEKMIPTQNGTSFFISEPIRLKDTVNILYSNKKYNLYNFTNTSEISIDGSNHQKISICRVSTATIDGHQIDDSSNNILRFKLE